MGDDAILSPAQEEAGLKAREISKQESAVVDKSQQLVNEKLELLKELKKLEEEEAKGKVEPGDTVEREIVGPAGEKEVEVVKEEPGGKEEVMEIKEETPEEAQEMADSGGELVEPPPPAPPIQEQEEGFEEFQCPPCPPKPKPRERPLMISAEDEPPGKAPRVEVDVTESYPAYPQSAPSLLLAPPSTVKTMRVSMPRPSPRIIEQDTAGDDRIRWEMPRHVPSATIGSAPQSLAGALMDNEVADENEVPEEYDEELQTSDQVHEALRGGHAFKPMEQVMPCLTAFLEIHGRDALFFHYSGHGGREENPNSASGYVETLCPEDCDKAGMLLDTELFEILVRPLPSGCRLTCLMDCCHSGGVLNLPYLFTGTQENLRQAFSGRAMNMAMSKDWLYNISALQRGNPMAFLEDVSSMGLGLWGLWKQQKTSKDADSNGFVADEQENVGLAVGEVVAITGCRSDQTSADVGNVHEDFQIAGRRASLQMGHRRSMPNTAAGGALTSVFMESLQAAQGISYLELLERIRGRLEEEDFEQVPQLATSLLIELNQPFSLTTISLPAKPNTKTQQQQQPGPGGLGVLGGAAAGAGASALLAGFMASMTTGRGPGQQMLQSATIPGGGMPYANMMSGMSNRGMADGGSFEANNFFHALQEDSDDDDWWEAATGHVRRMSSGKNHTEIHNYTEINQTVEQHNDNSMNFSDLPEETVNEVPDVTADVEDPVEDEPDEPEENEDEPDEPEENEDEPDEPEENEDEPDEPEENEDEPEEDEPDEVEEDEDEPDEPEDSEPEEEEDEPEEDEDFDDDDD
eukprot:symbB.v1.2.005755.t1/scaffold307.1/size232847/20